MKTFSEIITISETLPEEELLISIDMYKYDVTVVISNNILASRYRRNKLFEKATTVDEEPLGLFCEVNDFEGYIFIRPNSGYPTIAHECFHAVFAMLNNIGTTLDESSEECYAYALSYLMEQIEERLKITKIKTDDDIESD